MAEIAGKEGTSQDISRIESLLAEAGVTQYEPRVVGQLLEIAYASTRKVLLAGKDISVNCNKTIIDDNDIQLALEITGILGNKLARRERLSQLAAEKNTAPLPAIRHNFGLKLPNDRFCLLQQNVEWKSDGETTATAPAAPQFQPPAPAHPEVRPEHVYNILKRPAQDEYD